MDFILFVVTNRTTKSTLNKRNLFLVFFFFSSLFENEKSLEDFFLSDIFYIQCYRLIRQVRYDHRE
jgi:hypothetical protein